MQLTRIGEDTLNLWSSEDFFAPLLRQLLQEASPGDSEAALGRLYSAPIENPDEDPELIEDWESLVKPELKSLFQSANKTVADDISKMRAMRLEDGQAAVYEVRFPRKHADAWLSCLNQARLAIGARYSLTEEDMEEGFAEGLFDERDLARFQVFFYGWVQELILNDIGFGND